MGEFNSDDRIAHPISKFTDAQVLYIKVYLHIISEITYNTKYSVLLLLSHFSCVRLCATPSLGFSRQEQWSGLPFPSPVPKSET